MRVELSETEVGLLAAGLLVLIEVNEEKETPDAVVALQEKLDRIIVEILGSRGVLRENPRV